MGPVTVGLGPVTVTPHHARVRGTAGRDVSLFACAVRPLSFVSRKNSAQVSQRQFLVFLTFHVAGVFVLFRYWCFCLPQEKKFKFASS